VGWWGGLAGWWWCGSFAKETSIFVTINLGVSFLLASATESDDLCVCVRVRVKLLELQRGKEGKKAGKKERNTRSCCDCG
jgi:hypothetical protein